MGVLKSHARPSAVLLLATSLFVGTPVSAAPDEGAVKAAFLLNFARLVSWPPGALPAERIDVCIVGAGPSAEAASAMLAGKSVEGRRVEIRRTPASAGGIAGCHIVFVTDEGHASAAAVLRAARGRPLMIVGESEGFARQGAAINLYLEGGKVRFEVNLQAARDAGLDFSSHMLRLARIVEPTE